MIHTFDDWGNIHLLNHVLLCFIRSKWNFRTNLIFTMNSLKSWRISRLNRKFHLYFCAPILVISALYLLFMHLVHPHDSYPASTSTLNNVYHLFYLLIFIATTPMLSITLLYYPISPTFFVRTGLIKTLHLSLFSFPVYLQQLYIVANILMFDNTWNASWYL